MPIPVEPSLYEKIKKEVFKQYEKPSAYRSGALVKKYKEEFKKLYGDKPPYIDTIKKEPKSLENWFKEKWKDYAGFDYPTYRPTIRINKQTPLTVDEIKPSNLKKQAILKQKIKGKKNLPPFISKSAK
jgi:hypothetical protein